MLYEIASRYLLDPIGIAILILVGALIAEHYGRHGLGRGLVAAAALFLAAFAVLPLDEILARPLENAFPRPAPPAHVDGIVVLSGGTRTDLSASRGVMGDNATVLRMVAGAELARRYPTARLVFSGTSGGGATARAAEFAGVERFFRVLGVAPGRTIYERASRDTSENLTFTKDLAKPKPGETWLLVTSAMHMRRAMAVAQRLGWNMTAWPSDYSSSAHWRGRSWRPPSDGLLNFERALHEWIGLISYSLGGKS